MTAKPEMAPTIIDFEAFTVVEFLPRPSGSKTDDPSFLPKIVQRNHDGVVFKIGDNVTNGQNYQGKPCRGKITGFDFLEGKIFIKHSWSGIGWNLGSLGHIIVLPSKFQHGDTVWINFWGTHPSGEIIAVHFYPNKIKYDLLVIPFTGDTARIYNVEERMLSITHPDHKIK